MNKILFILLISLSAWAASYSVGEVVSPFDYPDQFGKKAVFTEMPRTVVFACEKGTSSIVNDFLNAQDAGYLKKNNAVFVADISGMPRFIAEAFGLPKMRKFVHSVLLIRDEREGSKFPSEKAKITIMKFNGNTFAAVSYISTVQQLKTAIEQ